MGKIFKGIGRATSIGKISLLPLAVAAMGGGPLAAGLAGVASSAGQGKSFGQSLLSGLMSGVTSGITSGAGAGGVFGGNNTMVGRLLNNAQGGFADSDLGKFFGAKGVTGLDAPSIGGGASSSDSPFSSIIKQFTGNSSDGSFGDLIRDEASKAVTSGADSGGGGFLTNLLGNITNNPLKTLQMGSQLYSSMLGDPVRGAISSEDILKQRAAKQAADAEYSRQMIAAMNGPPGTFNQPHRSKEDYYRYAFEPGQQPMVTYSSPQVPQLATGGQFNPMKMTMIRHPHRQSVAFPMTDQPSAITPTDGMKPHFDVGGMYQAAMSKAMPMATAAQPMAQDVANSPMASASAMPVAAGMPQMDSAAQMMPQNNGGNHMGISPMPFQMPPQTGQMPAPMATAAGPMRMPPQMMPGQQLPQNNGGNHLPVMPFRSPMMQSRNMMMPQRTGMAQQMPQMGGFPHSMMMPHMATGGRVPYELFSDPGQYADGGQVTPPMNLSPADIEIIKHLLSMDAEGGDRAIIKEPAPKPKKAKGGPSVPPTMTRMNTGRMYQGPGGGQDDTLDVGNAKLSPNEYVVQSDVVSALGDGNPDEGAKKLDTMGQNLRKHKATGKSSPRAKNPMSYIGKKGKK